MTKLDCHRPSKFRNVRLRDLTLRLLRLGLRDLTLRLCAYLRMEAGRGPDSSRPSTGYGSKGSGSGPAI